MKKIITVAILSILVSTSVLANKSKKYSFDDLYQKFSNVEGVEVININRFIIGLASLLIDDFDYSHLKNLEKLTILDVSSSPEKVKRDFKESIDKIDDMELLMEISEDSDIVKILIEKDKDHISRLLIVETGDPLIICIKCNMKTKDLNKFVAQLDGKITYTTKH